MQLAVRPCEAACLPRCRWIRPVTHTHRSSSGRAAPLPHFAGWVLTPGPRLPPAGRVPAALKRSDPRTLTSPLLFFSTLWLFSSCLTSQPEEFDTIERASSHATGQSPPHPCVADWVSVRGAGFGDSPPSLQEAQNPVSLRKKPPQTQAKGEHGHTFSYARWSTHALLPTKTFALKARRGACPVCACSIHVFLLGSPQQRDLMTIKFIFFFSATTNVMRGTKA